ncbi:Uu.00g119320.m01.CDS01 [Anthostomella pinea]|uniref:Uu.00g119320.m01.CDS01 n=1 Tax=Anthostomella pinea TaxID=933095 RepID=A0AAI8VGI5_9PEZI|nr:Uu.00g119320.m01.CDS01 [Anthostomella pinea]
MATIEPRLIHLLNESTATPRLHHAELPPINLLPLPNTSSRHHILEPDGSQRSEATVTNSGQLASQSIPSLYSVTDDGPVSTASRKDNLNYTTVDRTLLSHISSQDLRMILDDTPDNVEEIATKKRPVKEDFPQLPQPLKKQKATAQPHMFPPIIVGLLEPPSNAALFPPISSGSFDDRPRSEPPQALSITKPPSEAHTAAEDTTIPSPPLDADRTPSGKIKRRAAKPRRKWSEEETNHLLLGVSKHGVGKWTDILEDPEYKFSERTAGDLKDRFRTCCPDELRAKYAARGEAQVQKQATAKAGRRPKKGLMSENILNEAEEEAETENVQYVHNDSDSTPKQRKSRAHRKKMEDLAELGIKGPFRKSHRRERRPFSDQDDREILEGFELYGPQWTKIQRDARFNLSTRQPTDLRDRLRNKYPEKFVGTEKMAMQVREPGRNNDLMEPSVNMAIENSLNVSKSALLEPQLNRTSSREDMPKWPLPSSLMEAVESSQSHSSLYWGDSAAGVFSSGAIGEMDISRLLLDDTQVLSDPPSSDKRGFG